MNWVNVRAPPLHTHQVFHVSHDLSAERVASAARSHTQWTHIPDVFDVHDAVSALICPCPLALHCATTLAFLPTQLRILGISLMPTAATDAL